MAVGGVIGGGRSRGSESRGTDATTSKEQRLSVGVCVCVSTTTQENDGFMQCYSCGRWLYLIRCQGTIDAVFIELAMLQLFALSAPMAIQPSIPSPAVGLRLSSTGTPSAGRRSTSRTRYGDGHR